MLDPGMGAITPLTAVVALAGALPNPIPGDAVDLGGASGCADAGIAPSAETLDEARRATRCLLDYERTSHGRPPLHASASLARAAQRHSRSMAERHFFRHVSPGGSTLLDRVRATSYLDGAQRWHLGETIAWGAGWRATPQAIVASLMASEPHREIILDASFEDVGVGIAPEAPMRIGWDGPAGTYTAVFGARD